MILIRVAFRAGVKHCQCLRVTDQKKKSRLVAKPAQENCNQ